MKASSPYRFRTDLHRIFRRSRRAAVLAALLLGAPAGSLAVLPEPAPVPRYRLDVRLDPASGILYVKAEVSGFESPSGSVDFLLNSALVPSPSSRTPVSAAPAGDVDAFLGNDGETVPGNRVKLSRWRADVARTGGVLSVVYEGKVDVPLSDEKEQYARGFRDTPSALNANGVYLAGSSFWVPSLGGGLVSFVLTAAVPDGWHLVSQGTGTSRDARGMASWDSTGPVDEVYLVGGPLQRWRDASGTPEVLVYLRERDDALAEKYLSTSRQYLSMYSGLIGAYPYSKFAVVENFWETGYGMASFTLLGPQVIRFPFILHSSLPHEILHNWWGNSVFVDYAGGNWCEGLTAYLADHLVQEQRGKGDEYRRGTLQKYRDYVKEGRDFPLAEFRSRHSAATEAVGYGKSLMGFHELRLALGDESFRKFLRKLYGDFRGKKASFGDLRAVAEEVWGKNLGTFFASWVVRTGAPSLAVAGVGVHQIGPSFTVSGTLRQVQGGRPFPSAVPVAVQTPKGVTFTTIRMADGTTPLTEASLASRSAERPLALLIDPRFDLFRRLDPRETPPSLGMIFGEPRIVAILPSRAPREEIEAYRKIAEGWASTSHAVEVRSDAEVASIPADRSVWLFGRDNVHATAFRSAAPSLSLSSSSMKAGGEEMALARHSAIVVTRNPGNPEKAVGWLFADPLSALPGLGRKLPHYGRYSYLGFEGTEPVNVLKGTWAASDSPLLVDLRPVALRSAPLSPPPFPVRRALAELPPAFSRANLKRHVDFLAAPAREGRGPGQAGLGEAATYIEAEMKAIGLGPGGDGGGFRRTFLARGPDGTPVTLVNLVGILPGTNSALSGTDSVVVCAHYDHLGIGWPDVHKGDQGKVHPGADDNSSGVSVMLELARAFAAGEKPRRRILFVAFSAEEEGRLGSKAFVEKLAPELRAGVIGAVNLDTVGRLGDRKVTVLGTGTATEWPHIFRGAGFVTGIEGQFPPGQYEASDQMSFIEAGIPAVQLFSGAHADYHRPSDTPEKIDLDGMAKVAAYAREAIEYLAGRKAPLTVTIGAPPSSGGPKRAGDGGGRRVSFGTVPDFSHTGPGLRLDGTTPGSPAEKAGMVKGDLIVRVDGKPVEGMRGFSEILKALTPGQIVDVDFLREGKESKTRVTVVER